MLPTSLHQELSSPASPVSASRSLIDTPTIDRTEGAASAPGGSYLLVVEQQRSYIVSVPPAGVLVAGRSSACQIALDDKVASRQHARFAVEGGEVVVADLGSQNGTRVNGAPLGDEPRALVNGDVVAIGATQLIFHGERAGARRPIVERAAFRRCLELDVLRALRAGRPASLAVVEVGLGAPRLSQAIARVLGPLDTATVVAHELHVSWAERDRDEALVATRQLVDALAEAGVVRRAGLACAPEDAADAEALIAAARLALHGASPGEVSGPGAAEVRELGGMPVVVADPATIRLYGLVERLAASDLPVLIGGETGTGKEVVARALHALSPRAAGPLVTVNCAALPESLIESQLFGHDKGAFTGATGARAGLFEAADGGTIFLDELGELSPAAQAKLLRVLETRRVVRLGEVRERAVDVRVVAATNRDLGAESAAGRFRDDLYFRLAAARVVLPPLRDRPRELSRLARHFLDEACRRAGRTPLALSAATIYALRAHRWPGNVRELRHVMDYLAATAADDVEVEPWQLPDGIGHPAPAPPVVPAPAAPSAPTSRGSAAGGGFRPIDEELRELECQRMREALAAAEGVQTRAAELIGMPLRTFVTKSKQYGLRGGARRGRTS